MASRSKRRFVAALIAPLLVAGCSVGSNFVPPDPQLPQTSFVGDKAVADARLPRATDPAWWAVFRDPILSIVSPTPISTCGRRRSAWRKAGFNAA